MGFNVHQQGSNVSPVRTFSSEESLSNLDSLLHSRISPKSKFLDFDGCLMYHLMDLKLRRLSKTINDVLNLWTVDT